jgi:hypothetical protein
MNISRHPFRKLTFLLASGAAIALCGWLASIPGQAQDSGLDQLHSPRKPVTCTDAAGIIYERGTPGFERCLSEMEQAAMEQTKKEQAGKAAENDPKLQRKRARIHRSAPSSSPAPSPSSSE